MGRAMKTEIEDIAKNESIFIIGRVLSVEKRLVTIRVNKDKNSSHIIYKGTTVKNVSVGSYVKIVKGFIRIIGKVEGEKIIEERYYNTEYKREETRINRTLEVSLFGHFEKGKFKQGIKEMPLIDNECFLLNRDEFSLLHNFAKSGCKTIEIGGLTEEPAQRIRLGVNELFASHIGIFGNTGSGKSNTLAKIYTELFSLYKENKKFQRNSRFLIVDFNGEYTGDETITKAKQVFKLSTGRKGSKYKFPITVDNLKKTETLSVLLEATEKTQRPFLDWAIKGDYFDNPDTFNERIKEGIEDICKTVLLDKKGSGLREGTIAELFSRLTDLVETEKEQIIELRQSIEANLHYHSHTVEYYWSTPTSDNFNNRRPIYDTYIEPQVNDLYFKSDQLSVLHIKIVIAYFYAITRGFYSQEHIGPLMGRMIKKFKMLDKLVEIKNNAEWRSNLIILSLRDVNTEMKKIIPLLVCKQFYDEKKDDGKMISLHLIIDEAHNILSTASQRESDTWKDYRLETFEEIIKEGRKFGVFLTVASQRPYDISHTIISQLHNYFIHRLINDNDIGAVEKAVAYLDKLSFQTIPILSVGSCFVAGLASDIPVKVDVELLPTKQQPQSDTVKLEKEWD